MGNKCYMPERRSNKLIKMRNFQQIEYLSFNGLHEKVHNQSINSKVSDIYQDILDYKNKVKIVSVFEAFGPKASDVLEQFIQIYKEEMRNQGKYFHLITSRDELSVVISKIYKHIQSTLNSRDFAFSGVTVDTNLFIKDIVYNINLGNNFSYLFRFQDDHKKMSLTSFTTSHTTENKEEVKRLLCYGNHTIISTDDDNMCIYPYESKNNLRPFLITRAFGFTSCRLYGLIEQPDIVSTEINYKSGSPDKYIFMANGSILEVMKDFEVSQMIYNIIMPILKKYNQINERPEINYDKICEKILLVCQDRWMSKFNLNHPKYASSNLSKCAKYCSTRTTMPLIPSKSKSNTPDFSCCIITINDMIRNENVILKTD
jgi:hypothetical protein